VALIGNAMTKLSLYGKPVVPTSQVATTKLNNVNSFLLCLEGDGKEPSFHVSERDDTTALMKAGYYPGAGPQLSEILSLLLKKFPRVEQLNARSSRKSKTAAIQGAIAANNVAAVRAFVQAGADLTIRDPSNNSLLDLAINAFYTEFGQSKNVKKKSKDEQLGRCLDIISILSEAAPWPMMLERSIVFQTLLAETKEVVDLMMLVPHFISEKCRLHVVLSQIVAQHVPVVLNGDLLALMETRRQLDRILRPVFQVELRLLFHLIEDPACAGIDISWKSDEMSKAKAIEKLPILKQFNLATYNRLKQASLFECMLEGERRAPFNPESPLGRTGFWKFARSGNREDLLYDHKYVIYPESLLECWSSVITADYLEFDSPEAKLMVMKFAQTLRIRAKEMTDGIWPLSRYDQDFTRFHFREVLGLDVEIESESLEGVLGLSWHCRCMRGRIGTLSVQVAQELDEVMTQAAVDRKQDGISPEYYKKKELEVEEEKAASEWKRLVLESELFLERDLDGRNCPTSRSLNFLNSLSSLLSRIRAPRIRGSRAIHVRKKVE